jgi:hypothetical protein
VLLRSSARLAAAAAAMDSLKALLAKKKAEKQELVGDKKSVRRGDLEEAKLKRLREEEEQERLAKVWRQAGRR